jgi:hypothetical protein
MERAAGHDQHSGVDEEGICGEEILIIKAHDPDSSITEIQVWFDEDGDRAPFVYVHTLPVALLYAPHLVWE